MDGDAPLDVLTPDLWILVWQHLPSESDKGNFAATCRYACAAGVAPPVAGRATCRTAGRAGPLCRAASSRALHAQYRLHEPPLPLVGSLGGGQLGPTPVPSAALINAQLHI